jgi:FlaA1/EpsC-like NDP-sugar epimerase
MARLLTKYGLDVLIWWSLTPLAFLLRLEQRFFEFAPAILLFMMISLPAKAAAVFLAGLFRRAWRKVGIRDLYALMTAIGAVTVLFSVLISFFPAAYTVPRSVPLIEGLLALIALGGMRMALRLSSERYRLHSAGGSRKARRVLIAGAGEAGAMVAREMMRHPEAGRQPVGYLDDDPGRRRAKIVGLPVLGPLAALPEMVEAMRVDEVLIAMPSQGPDVMRRVLELARVAGVEHRTLPAIHDLLSGSVSINEIREVDLEDLLGREPVRLDMEEIAAYLKDRVVLITGAGGSIGSEIVRQVAGFRPRLLVLLGRGENSIYDIDRQIGRDFPGISRVPVITDLRDAESLRAVFDAYRPEVVFHAAAHKHVPLMEANPSQAIFNNVAGTRNVVDLALEYGVSRLVNVSTDKAVNPSSVMGASKRVAELIVHRASTQCDDGCHFVSVRFGNVLGSRGSVIPLFRSQILAGGPVTVTHPEMQRYFMTIPEATQLVLQAGSMPLNGAVYALDMGTPVRIVDLARDMILLCGKEPGVDIAIEFTGMRPGEKLFEELLLAEEGTVPSQHEKLFTARGVGGGCQHLDAHLEILLDAAASRDAVRIQAALTALVPTCSLGEDAPTLAPPTTNGRAPAAQRVSLG